MVSEQDMGYGDTVFAIRKPGKVLIVPGPDFLSGNERDNIVDRERREPGERTLEQAETRLLKRLEEGATRGVRSGNMARS